MHQELLPEVSRQRSAHGGAQQIERAICIPVASPSSSSHSCFHVFPFSANSAERYVAAWRRHSLQASCRDLAAWRFGRFLRFGGSGVQPKQKRVVSMEHVARTLLIDRRGFKSRQALSGVEVPTAPIHSCWIIQPLAASGACSQAVPPQIVSVQQRAVLSRTSGQDDGAFGAAEANASTTPTNHQGGSRAASWPKSRGKVFLGQAPK